MAYCYLSSCPSDSRYDPDKSLSFHRLPVDKDLRSKWINNIKSSGHTDIRITDSARICSLHFRADDFVRTLTGIKKLKKDAVPSIVDVTVPRKRRVRRPPIRCVIKEVTVTKGSGRDDTGISSGAVSVRHDHKYADPQSTEEKLQEANCRIQQLEETLRRRDVEKFAVERISFDPQLLSFYTGFSDQKTFMTVFRSIRPNSESVLQWEQLQKPKGNLADVLKNEALPLLDQFFMFLCFAKLGLFEQDLSVRFNIPVARVTRILTTWASFLYFVLGSFVIWPSRDEIEKNFPECLKHTYPNARIIVECIKIRVQNPCSKIVQSEPYRNDATHNKMKGLVGVTPSGAVSFLSTLYLGNTSHQELAVKSGLINLLEYGDQVMSNSELPIDSLLCNRGCALVCPPFVEEYKNEIGAANHIPVVQEHVDRCIRRVKEFHILDGIIPSSLADSANQIWSVCCILNNVRGSLK